MDPSIVETLLDAFGPFLFPAVLFAAGVVGYGVLLLAGRLLSREGTGEWSTGTVTETAAMGEEPTDTDRHEG